MFRFPKHYKKALLILFLALGVCLVPYHTASADYVQNNLIDDNLFLDAASMSQSQIQSFLVARGSYLANYSSYSSRDGGNVLASQIIYEAAQDYGISPKIILATMQKEQSLVTATNPTSTQIQRAMGYGCPDKADCNAKYYGLFNQVDNGAWQFRKNYERARGNTSWWSSSPGYACSGTTRYYSTGLYVGRNVTFYDDNGAAIQTFTLNNPSTASLYCYTPHPYNNPNGLYGNPSYGSTGLYYSGSYNFVLWFERWFGSTQPAVTVTSPLQIQTEVPEGAFTGKTLTLSFTLKNSTPDPQNLGSMMIACRDSANNNCDFGFKDVTIPAKASYTYTTTTTLPKEDTYTFYITNYFNGQWRENFPLSSSIDNPRRITDYFVQAPPTIIQQPTAASEFRVGKSTGISFQVKNNSSRILNLGLLGLALRDAVGRNRDLPFDSVTSLAAGATYTYTKTFKPQDTGQYSGFVAGTRDGGVTWYSQGYPVTAAGTTKNISFTVLPSPTLTQGPLLNIATPHVGQQVTTSFKVKNYGDTAKSLGWVGIAIRDPQGRNVDAGGLDLTVNANSEYTFQATPTFQTPGTYTAWVMQTGDGGRTWNNTNYPVSESGGVVRRITFTVLPNPTLTQGPVLSISSPHVGQQVTTSFKVKNYGDTAKSLGWVGIAIRDPQGRNVDAGGLDLTVNANSEYTFQATPTFQTPGTYTAWVMQTGDGGRTWNNTNYPVSESGGVVRRITFTVLP